MLKSGILNPAINSLLSRVRHTNSLVIADRGFPYWPQLETIDLSLIDGIPTVLQVLSAIRGNFVLGEVLMAEEFLSNNDATAQEAFKREISGVKLSYASHVDFKKRVPAAIGLIRTGDTTQYANMILVSA